ncbi:MAG TPA: gliding motility-associated C-terminal domain-containing protein, partial [Saprospiraceae bacterium]|nr:gliding motility-associated C-terminal domain-containing protein [Saprospiraceae bacterium]
SQVDSLVWALGDHLSCTHCINPTLYGLFDEIITATVYAGGCVDSDMLALRVDVDAKIYIPNVFSPNGDGINDHVTVFTDDKVRKIVYLEIFDRWGNQVFVANNIEPNDPLLGWDGSFKGKPMNPAVFAYIARVELINGQQIDRKGGITLVR